MFEDDEEDPQELTQPVTTAIYPSNVEHMKAEQMTAVRIKRFDGSTLTIKRQFVEIEQWPALVLQAEIAQALNNLLGLLYSQGPA